LPDHAYLKVSAGSAFTRDRKDGSDATGSDGDTNRVLTLSATPSFMIHIFVGGAPLHHTDDYTVSGADVTFLNALFNSQKIEVVYV